MNAQSLNWDDLRVFLAVARAGSLSGAARKLGVNHSTVFRRIAGFEQALGVRLFERLPNGYALTPAGEETLAIAERIEADFASIDRTLVGRDLRLSGVVRITTTDMLALWLLPDHLERLRATCPAIEIEIATGNESLDLSQRETDIALRIANSPPETLVGRRVGELDFAIYGASAYCAAHPGSGLGGHDWIGLDRAHAPLMRQLREFAPEVRPVTRSNSVACTVQLARAGLGLAVLPCVIADRQADLVRLVDLPATFRLGLWLLTHEDLRHTARIRAVMAFLADALTGDLTRDLTGSKA